jgi:hypothetical protein
VCSSKREGCHDDVHAGMIDWNTCRGALGHSRQAVAVSHSLADRPEDIETWHGSDRHLTSTDGCQTTKHIAQVAMQHTGLLHTWRNAMSQC